MKINYKGESKILKELCEQVNKVTEDAGTLAEMIGDTQTLTTEDKSSVVSALNEVRGMIDGILEGAS